MLAILPTGWAKCTFHMRPRIPKLRVNEAEVIATRWETLDNVGLCMCVCCVCVCVRVCACVRACVCV